MRPRILATRSFATRPQRSSTRPQRSSTRPQRSSTRTQRSSTRTQRISTQMQSIQDSNTGALVQPMLLDVNLNRSREQISNATPLLDSTPYVI